MTLTTSPIRPLIASQVQICQLKKPASDSNCFHHDLSIDRLFWNRANRNLNTHRTHLYIQYLGTSEYVGFP